MSISALSTFSLSSVPFRSSRVAPPPTTQAKPALQAISTSPSIHNTQRTGLDLSERLRSYAEITAKQLKQELLALNLGLNTKQITRFADAYAQNGKDTLTALLSAGLPNLEFGGRIGITLKRRVRGIVIGPQQRQTLSQANENSFAEFKIRKSTKPDIFWPDVFWLKTRLPQPILRNPKGILKDSAKWPPGLDERDLSNLVSHNGLFSLRFLDLTNYPPLTLNERENLLAQAKALNDL